ncbi:MAG: hypothetical protein IAE85_09920 [Anaerolinea sp.]|nr:hypothetical protein [Anaerolinea sp.]
MIVEQLQSEIKALSESDFARLRKWFLERDWELWDHRLKADVASGKLDFLVDQAMEAKSLSNL